MGYCEHVLFNDCITTFFNNKGVCLINKRETVVDKNVHFCTSVSRLEVIICIDVKSIMVVVMVVMVVVGVVGNHLGGIGTDASRSCRWCSWNLLCRQDGN